MAFSYYNRHGKKIQRWKNHNIPFGIYYRQFRDNLWVDIEYRKEAISKYNIKDFILCPCLNDSTSFAKTIIELSNINKEVNMYDKII